MQGETACTLKNAICGDNSKMPLPDCAQVKQTTYKVTSRGVIQSSVAAPGRLLSVSIVLVGLLLCYRSSRVTLSKKRNKTLVFFSSNVSKHTSTESDFLGLLHKSKRITKWLYVHTGADESVRTHIVWDVEALTWTGLWFQHRLCIIKLLEPGRVMLCMTADCDSGGYLKFRVWNVAG